MKILLINPPRTYYRGSKGVRLGLPLGIMYLAAVLEKNGYQPKIFDCLIHPQAEIVKRGDKIIHGVAEDKILEIIRQESPQVVGITNPFTAQIDNALKVADLVKQINPEIITVLGGPHVSVAGQKLLEQNKNIDIGVKGEGEYIFLEIIRNFENNKPLSSIENIIYQDRSGQVKQTESNSHIKNLDDLPYPAYHLIDMDLYFHLLEKGLATRPSAQKRSVSFITSRGCPYNCIFCSIHLHMGRLWRAHSAEYVIKHIDYLVKHYGLKHISFEDDNFTLDMNRVEEILRGIIERNIRITWDTPNGVRADRLDEDLAQLMKKSGCLELIFGVESGDQQVLNKIIKKNLDLNSVIKAAEICQKLKIKTQAFFVIGFPGEKIKNIRKTMDFALFLRKKYGVKSGFLIAAPLIGTELYDICKKNGYLVKEPDARSLAVATQARGEGLIKTKDFSPDQLKNLAFELDKKMARIELWERVKNPATYLKTIKFLILHPLKSIKHFRERILAPTSSENDFDGS